MAIGVLLIYRSIGAIESEDIRNIGVTLIAFSMLWLILLYYKVSGRHKLIIFWFLLTSYSTYGLIETYPLSRAAGEVVSYFPHPNYLTIQTVKLFADRGCGSSFLAFLVLGLWKFALGLSLFNFTLLFYKIPEKICLLVKLILIYSFLAIFLNIIIEISEVGFFYSMSFWFKLSIAFSLISVYVIKLRKRKIYDVPLQN